MSIVGNKVLKRTYQIHCRSVDLPVPQRWLSSKTNSRAARQQTSRDLRIPTCRYHVHKNMPWNPFLWRLAAVNSGTPYFYNMIYCDNIVSRTPLSRKWSVPLFSKITFCRLSHFFRACFMPVCFHPSMCGATAPSGVWPPSKGASLLLLLKLVSSIVFLGPVCITLDDSSVLSLLLLITVPRYLKLRTTSVSWSLVSSNIPCAKNQILFPMARTFFKYIYKFWGPCILIYSYNRSQQDALFLNFISIYNSTCFGQTYCPSSGVLIVYSQQLVFVILFILTVC